MSSLNEKIDSISFSLLFRFFSFFVILLCLLLIISLFNEDFADFADLVNHEENDTRDKDYDEEINESQQKQQQQDENDFNTIRFDPSEIRRGEYFEKTNEEGDTLEMLNDPKKEFRLQPQAKLELLDKVGKQMLDDEQKLFQKAREEYQKEQLKSSTIKKNQSATENDDNKLSEAAGTLHDEFLPFERIYGTNRRDLRDAARHWPDEPPPKDRVEQFYDDDDLRKFKEGLSDDRFMVNSKKQQEKELGEHIEKNIFRFREAVIFEKIKRSMMRNNLNMKAGNDVRERERIFTELYGREYKTVGAARTIDNRQSNMFAANHHSHQDKQHQHPTQKHAHHVPADGDDNDDENLEKHHQQHGTTLPTKRSVVNPLADIMRDAEKRHHGKFKG